MCKILVMILLLLVSFLHFMFAGFMLLSEKNIKQTFEINFWSHLQLSSAKSIKFIYLIFSSICQEKK